MSYIRSLLRSSYVRCQSQLIDDGRCDLMYTVSLNRWMCNEEVSGEVQRLQMFNCRAGVGGGTRTGNKSRDKISQDFAWFDRFKGADKVQ